MLCSWLHPSLAIRPSPLHGRGTFATAPIGAGEVVTVWVHRVLTREEVVHAPPGNTLRRAWSGQGDTWLWQPPDDRAASDHFLNHACDANVWMADEVTLVARRPVAAGEELTADYALWELDPEWVSPFRCLCGVAECRGVVTGRDWEDPELQRRYAAHFHPVLNARIGAQSTPPGEPADL